VRPGFMRRMRKEGSDRRWRDLDRRAYGLLWRYLYPHGAAVAASVVLLLVASTLALLPPLVVRSVIDGHLLHRMTPLLSLNALAGLLVVAAALSWAIDAARHAVGVTLGQRVVAALRRDVIAAVLSQPPSWTRSRGTGTLVSNATSDVDELAEFVSTGATNTVGDGLTLVAGVAAMAWLAPTLTLAVVPVFPVLVLGLAVLGSLFRAASRDERVTAAAVVTGAEEGVGGVRVVQSVVAEDRSTDQFAGVSRAAARAKVRSTTFFATIMPMMSFASAAATAVVVAVGAHEVAASRLTAGVVVAFLWYVRILFGPLRELSLVAQQLAGSAASLERLVDVIEAPPTLAFPADSNEEPRSGPATLTFDAVTFGYEAGSPVLNAVDLEVPAGSMLVIAGPSGSGKSTLAWLAARLHDPTDGVVAVDGVDLRTLSRRDLRRRIVLVPQDVFLFPGTVARNVRLARPDGDLDEAVDVLGLRDFLATLPQGLQTDVGEGGVRLSGGQRRLVALLRAALTEAPVVVLDEPLAGVDALLTRTVRGALSALAGRRTVVITTHRLRELVDGHTTVAVIDDGRFAGPAGHETLLAANETYRRLWTAG